MSLRLQLIIVALLTAVFLAGWWSYDSLSEDGASKKKKTSARSTLVLVEKITLADDIVTIRTIGSGKAIRSAALHPAVSGEVKAIQFNAEQRVQEGQTLILLDDKHQRLKLKLAQIELADAERQLVRMKKLAPSGHAAQSRLDTAQSLVNTAHIHLEQAHAEMQDRNIIAPFAGIVGMTNLSVGDRVSEETMAVTLDDRSELIIEFDIPEIYANQITVGDVVTVKPWSGAQQWLSGNIVAMGSRIDLATRTLPVQGKIANPKDVLRPGASFEVKIIFTGKAYPIVREIAVLWSRDGAYLWRIRNDKADKVFVKMIRRDQGRVLVDGPLRAGDLVVVEGVQGLRLGQEVKAAPFDPEVRKSKS